MSANFELLAADSLSASERHAFLQSAFAAEKATFLTKHEAWAYHQSRAVYYIRDAAGELVAYNALIETQISLNGQIQAALWLVDIIVLPAYRGKGLQRLLDDAVRELPHLQIGFPNQVAAPIHKKHGWGVRQEAYKLFLPLSLRVSKQVRYSQKFLGKMARWASALLSPLYFAQWAWRMRRYQAKSSQRMSAPSPQALAEIFAATPFKGLTSYRDAAFLQWRYFDAPYADDLRFYQAGTSLALICRYMDDHSLKTLRILDIFGNLEDTAALEDLLRLVLREAASEQIEQISAITSHPQILASFERLGFWRKAAVEFCWYNPDEQLMQAVEQSSSHWVYADSDFDYP